MCLCGDTSSSRSSRGSSSAGIDWHGHAKVTRVIIIITSKLFFIIFHWLLLLIIVTFPCYILFFVNTLCSFFRTNRAWVCVCQVSRLPKIASKTKKEWGLRSNCSVHIKAYLCKVCPWGKSPRRTFHTYLVHRRNNHHMICHTLYRASIFETLKIDRKRGDLFL